MAGWACTFAFPGMGLLGAHLVKALRLRGGEGGWSGTGEGGTRPGGRTGWSSGGTSMGEAIAMSGNERRELCAECGGQCCRSRPGIEAPERFLSGADPAAALAAALASGEWVLAEHVGVPWLDGVEPPESERRRVIRYPRPATVLERGGAPRDDLAPCVFLSEGGCRLSFGERPRACRALVPTPGFECEGDWGRREAALAWLPHQEWVAAAMTRAAGGGP